MSEQVDVLARFRAEVVAADKRIAETTGSLQSVYVEGRARSQAAHDAVAVLIERLEASDWRLSNLLVFIPAGRPERAQIEQDMADNRAALDRARGKT